MLLTSTALLVGSVAAVAPVTAPATADNLHARQHQAHGQVRSALGALEESSRSQAAARRRLGEARAALGRAQRRLDLAQAQATAAGRLEALALDRLLAAQRRLDLAQRELAAARQRVLDQRAAIGALAASDYADGGPGLMGLSVILTSQDPAEATSRMNTVDSLMSRQTTLLVQLKGARAALARQEILVAEARTRVAAQQRAAEANLQRKQALERSATSARAQVASLVARSHTAAVLAARARSADLAKLARARSQEDRIRRLILARARREHGGFRGSSGGFLTRPVPGYVTSPYGWRIHPIYHYWGLHDGTDFHAPCGTPERASASGTVISESWSDVYGNRLYLDLGRVNGHNMTVVYNHLASYSVRTGQHLGRGQVVGLAGTTGWSTGCHLHFTVLVDGQPVDPMHYM